MMGRIRIREFICVDASVSAGSPRQGRARVHSQQTLTRQPIEANVDEQVLVDTPRLRNGRCHDDNLVDLVRGDLGSYRLLACPGSRPQGHSFFGYLIFSLFFFPAAIIVAYMVPDRGVAGC